MIYSNWKDHRISREVDVNFQAKCFLVSSKVASGSVSFVQCKIAKHRCLAGQNIQMRLSIGFNPLPGWECDPVFTPLIIMRSFIKNQYHGQIAMLKANGPLVRLTLPLTYGFMVRNGRRDHKPTSNLQNFPVSSRARTTSGSRPLTSGSRRVNAETNKL